MKKYLFIFIVLFLFPLNVFCLDLDTYSSNVLLYNLNDDEILYEKNSDEKVSIASITKVMTAIVSLEHIDSLDEKVTLVNSDFYGLYEANASVAGFRSGEEVTYRDLLCGLLLPSGADGAMALARLVGGSVDNFVSLMNDKAHELGMINTSFANTTGLDDPNNYSTLKDIYIMFKYAISNEDFLNIIKLRTYTISNGRLNLKSTIQKSIDFYGISGIDYLIGGKSGSTGDAGLCLASLAEYGGVRYILITTGAPFLRDKAYTLLDAKTVYEYFMNNYSYKNIVDVGDEIIKLDTLYTKEDFVSIKAKSNISKYLDNDFSKNKLKFVYDGITLVTSKMDKSTILGNVKIYYGDKLLDTIEVKLDNKLSFSLYKYLLAHKAIVFGSLFSIIIIILIIIKLIRKR